MRFLLLDLKIVILMKIFPTIRGEKSQFQNNGEKSHGLNHLFLILTLPPIKQSELYVQNIIYLQNLANRLPDAFIDSTKVT